MDSFIGHNFMQDFSAMISTMGFRRLYITKLFLSNSGHQNIRSRYTT